MRLILALVLVLIKITLQCSSGRWTKNVSHAHSQWLDFFKNQSGPSFLYDTAEQGFSTFMTIYLVDNCQDPQIYLKLYFQFRMENIMPVFWLQQAKIQFYIDDKQNNPLTTTYQSELNRRRYNILFQFEKEALIMQSNAVLLSIQYDRNQIKKIYMAHLIEMIISAACFIIGCFHSHTGQKLNATNYKQGGFTPMNIQLAMLLAGIMMQLYLQNYGPHVYSLISLFISVVSLLFLNAAYYLSQTRSFLVILRQITLIAIVCLMCLLVLKAKYIPLIILGLKIFDIAELIFKQDRMQSYHLIKWIISEFLILHIALFVVLFNYDSRYYLIASLFFDGIVLAIRQMGGLHRCIQKVRAFLNKKYKNHGLSQEKSNQNEICYICGNQLGDGTIVDLKASNKIIMTQANKYAHAHCLPQNAFQLNLKSWN